MIAITNYLEDIRKRKIAAEESSKLRRVYFKLTPEQFREIFTQECEIEMIKRNINKRFIVDDTNREAINQIYYYLIGSPQFNDRHEKSLIIAGSIGTGKTIMANAICNMVLGLAEREMIRIHAKRLSSEIISKEEGFYDKKMLMIDDLGREPKEANDFGNKSTPMIDLFYHRYEIGSWTIATTNFKLNTTLREFYGDTFYDRVIESFAVIEIKGESKRR